MVAPFGMRELLGTQQPASDVAVICDHRQAGRVALCQLLTQNPKAASLKTPSGPSCDDRVVPRGGRIYHQKRPEKGVFIIHEGAVRVFQTMVDGRRSIIRFLFRGDVLWADHATQHTFDAEAITAVRLCWLAGHNITQQADEKPQIWAFLAAQMSEDLQLAQDHLVAIGRKSAVERLAVCLIMLANRQRYRGLSINPVYLPMSRSDIADYLGLTTETVSRSFSQLKADGQITALHKTAVRICDIDALSRIANGF